MGIIQENFYIPEEITSKLITGEYVRAGGVVRHAMGTQKGQIVKHLKPINVIDIGENRKILAKVTEYISENKTGLIITGVFAVAIIGSGIYISKKKERPSTVSEFKDALIEYVNALRNGDIRTETVSTLMDKLELIKQSKNADEYIVELNAMDLEPLIDKIYEYTIKLALDNFVSIDKSVKSESECAIINLQDYLKIQFGILSKSV